MSTVTVLLYGKLSDLFGRKPLLFIGISLFLIGSLLCGFATSMEMLIGFRFLQGLGAGAVMPIATTIIGDIYSTEERAKIQGYLASVWGISAVSGPAIGGLLVDTVGWQFVFWVTIPLGILAITGVFLFLHEPIREKKVSIDYKGAILLTFSLVAILYWLVEGGQSFGRTSVFSIVLLTTGTVLFLLFVKVERSAPDPLMPFSMWKNPVILFANIVSFTTGIILIGISSYLPAYVTGVMEQPAMIAGFTLTAMSVGWPIASSVAGRLFLRYGPFTISFVGGISLVLGAVMFFMMNAQSGPWWAAMSSFFTGVGMGLTGTSFIVAIQSSVPREIRGMATATNMFMRNFGNTVGAALLGAILNASLMRRFNEEELGFSVDDVKILLTEKARMEHPANHVLIVQEAFHDGLHLVYITTAIFAVISLIFIFGIPRGKGFQNDDN